MEIRAEYKRGMSTKVVKVNDLGPKTLIGQKGVKVSYAGEDLPSGYSNVVFQDHKEFMLLPDICLDPSYLSLEEDEYVCINIPLFQFEEEDEYPSSYQEATQNEVKRGLVRLDHTSNYFIWVNPEHVTMLAPYNLQEGTVVSFVNNVSTTVKGAPEEVAKLLNL